MTAVLLLALGLSAPPVEVTLVVPEKLPAAVEVVRLVRPTADAAWQVADLRKVEVHSGRFVTAGPAGVESLLIVRVEGRPGYLMHGPLRWPAEPTTIEMNPEWRRTVRGQHPSGGSVIWLSQAPPRVLCEWTLLERWECLGVPRSAAGVVVRAGASGILYSVVGAFGSRNDVEDLPTAAAAWGRLLVVENVRALAGQDETAPLRAHAFRVYRPPARPNSTRLEVVADGRIQVNPIGAMGLWVTGSADTPGSWLDLAIPDVGAGRIDVAELADGGTDVVFSVVLERPVAVFGRVTGPLAAPVADTIVSLYRFGDEVRSPDTKKTTRERIAVGERHTDAGGTFAFPDLPPERYELLAVHPEYGRAVRLVEPHASVIELTLKPPPAVEGRVLRQGVPQGRVPVVFVPDLAAFAAAEDPAELRGSEGQTDANGRFRVLAAIRGNGELKIGSAPGPVKRVPLPAADALPPVMQLGDIELDAGPVVTIVFEEAGGCQPILTGPLGRTGLTVVRAVRLGPAMFNATLPESGRWNVVALCGQRERAVVPSMTEIKPDMREATLYLHWP